MADIILAGSTSGSITVSSPAISGTNTLTLPAVTDTLVGLAATQTLTNKSIAATQLTGTIAVGRLPAGSVLQVVQATSAAQASTTSTSFVSTAFSASITPTSATSKVLILTSAAVSGSATNCQPVYTIFRGATNLGDSSRGFGQAFSSAGGVNAQAAMQYLDSPATTSSTTYTVYLKVNLGTGIWGADNGTQVMVLMEIAA